MWRKVKWILLGLVLVVVALAIIFLIMMPKRKEMANVAVPPFNDPVCTRTFEPQFSAESYYQGPLFDSHFHIPSTFKSRFNNSAATLEKSITLSEIICELEKEKVVGAIAFYAPNPWLMTSTVLGGDKPLDGIIQQWLAQGTAIHQGLPDWAHLLYDPLTDNVGESQKAFETEIYDGFGELVYIKGQSPRPGAKVDDTVSQAIEKIANDHKLVAYVHPEQADKAALENVLAQFPDATFIFHGWDHDDYVMDLMNKYPNIYFTLDAAEFYMEWGAYETSESKFRANFAKDFQKNLDKAVSQWKPQIERHPDRFLWGTDRFKAFHYSEEMGKWFEEFGRAFLGQIPPEYQEYIAYKNAERLFSADKSDLPKTNQSEKKQSLGDLPENVRLCVIEKIGENKWRELSTSLRPATPAEEQVIDQCSH